MGLRIGIVLILLSVSAPVRAQVCTVLDETRDTLAPEDRRAAVLSLMQALQKNGEQVVQQGCAATYTVYHVKLGATISVYLYGPQGYREGRAGKLDELPLVYEQLVAALLRNQPVGAPGTVDRTNATSDQMVPRRVAADDMKFLRLGYGSVTGGDLAGGPSFGFGWRFELDKFALEISILNLIVATDHVGSQSSGRRLGITSSFVQLSGIFFANPLADYTGYVGGGVSWGGSAVYEMATEFSGSGLQGNAFAGYEMFRSSTMRLFVQADAQLPFYQSTPDFCEFSMNCATGSRYTPSFSLSVGVGWGKPNTIGVVQR
jgi:hypothetical protein